MIVKDIKIAFLNETLESLGLPFKVRCPKDSLKFALAKGSESEAKFLRNIKISFKVTAPLYWFLEFDTYKIGVTSYSDSVMHTALQNKITLNDFEDRYNNLKDRHLGIIESINLIIADQRSLLISKEQAVTQIKSILPGSYLYTRFITMNYAVLAHMYADRKNHKLSSWREFLNAFSHIPYYDEFIAKDI